MPYLSRGRKTLAALRREANLEAVLVVAEAGLRVATPQATLAFHPSTAKIRIANLKQGRGDPMVKAMALQPGDRVFDCTLGLGVDAIVCAYVVGETGAVHAAESSLPVYLVVSHGLQHYPEKNADLAAAMRRIRCQYAEAALALRRVERGWFDVIYCDPFFSEPVMASCAIRPLRLFGHNNPDKINAALEEAILKAGRCVVIKGRRGTARWKHLPITRVLSGKASSLEYAVIETR